MLSIAREKYQDERVKQNGAITAIQSEGPHDSFLANLCQATIDLRVQSWIEKTASFVLYVLYEAANLNLLVNIFHSDWLGIRQWHATLLLFVAAVVTAIVISATIQLGTQSEMRCHNIIHFRICDLQNFTKVSIVITANNYVQWIWYFCRKGWNCELWGILYLLRA